jgi:hypothetical protein
MNTIPKWGPRLARLYSEDVRKLEAIHAGRLSPGTRTWHEAVVALYHRMSDVGPVKRTRLLTKAAAYLNALGRDERAHLMLSCGGGSRNSHLSFATFSYGNHPDARVREEGLTLSIHIIYCSRASPCCSSNIPVTFISKHAISRLYERGHDISENSHATSVFAFLGVLGFLAHRGSKHLGGGLHLRFSTVLAAGGLHRFVKTYPNGRVVDECVYDVRTVLAVDELSPSKAAMLEQGQIAAGAVLEWFKGGDDLDENALAERIPRLPRHDSYSARAGGAAGEPQ